MSLRSNIILYGPPGIGKSTIIKQLKADGIPALDLESIYPDPIRFAVPNLVNNMILGAADLSPKKYNNCVKILLYLPQKQYEARREARDKAVPGKGQQQQHNIDDWLKGTKYNYVINADDDVVSKILKIYRRK